MNTKIDNKRYDAYARSFLAALTKHIEYGLGQTKLSKKERKVAARSLTFYVASLLDGSGSVDHKKRPLIPHIAFERYGEKFSVIDDGTIALHELCDMD